MNHARNKMEQTPIFRSVAFSLFRHVFVAYVVIAVVITGYQTWDEYQVTKQQHAQSLKDSVMMLQQGLAEAVLQSNRLLINELIEGMLSRDAVIGVRVLDHRQQLLAEQGNTLNDNGASLVHQFELRNPNAPHSAALGSVIWFSSPEKLFEILHPTLHTLMITAALKTLALWILFFYFGRRLLGQPLARMVSSLDSKSLRDLTRRVQPEHMNEIEKLSVAILNIQESSKRLLTRSEQRLQQILDAAGEGILVLDHQGKVNFGNPAACELFRADVSELMGADPRMLFAREESDRERPERPCEIQQVLVTARSFERQDTQFYRRDGSAFPVSFKSSPIIEGGKVTGVVVVFQDITEQKQQELVLRHSRNTYQTLLDSLPEQVVYKTPNQICISSNRAFAESMGLQANQIPGRRLIDMYPAEEVRRVEMADLRAIQSGESIKFESNRQQGDELVYTQTISAPVFDYNHEVAGVLNIIWDITNLKLAEKERQRMEVQLHQAQKLESVGQLAAGIAHEINTPVQFVSDNTNFLQDAFKDMDSLLTQYRSLLETLEGPADKDELLQTISDIEQDADLDYLRDEIPNAIEQSQSGLQRISKIVLAMKEFSHPGTNEKTPTDLNHAIQSTIDVSRNEWKYDSEMITDFDEHLPLVPVLPGEFNQVILNLIINAAHAVHAVHGKDHQGQIIISTRRKADQVEVRVKDNGTGIPVAIRKRIFDPFFTTKQVGKGTGQGLAIAYSAIVDKHGGEIVLDSEENVGSTFTLRLPLNPVETKETDNP